MTKADIELINLINEGKSINEICDSLNVTRNKIYKKLLTLKNNGYSIKNSYYYNGDITYQLIHGNMNYTKDTVMIDMKKNENNFRAMVISDLHIGSDKQRLDLLYQVYNYCIKNNINIILNTGDVVDGWIGKNKKINKDIEHQLEYFIKKHPFDKNILNFICFGNHDVDSYVKFGINLKTILENYRQDLIAFTSTLGYIKVKHDNLVLCHQTDNRHVNLKDIKNSIIFEGHHHKFMTSFNNTTNNHLIYVPSLSEIYINNQITFPTALVIDFDLEAGLFSKGIISQLISNGNEFIKIGEFKLTNIYQQKKNNNQEKEHVNTNNQTEINKQSNNDEKPKSLVKKKDDNFENMLKDFKHKQLMQKKYKYE